MRKSVLKVAGTKCREVGEVKKLRVFNVANFANNTLTFLNFVPILTNVSQKITKMKKSRVEKDAGIKCRKETHF